MFSLTTTSPAAAAEPLTMSSREIAELTGKRHDHVIRDVRSMMDALLEGDAPNLGNLEGVRAERDARGYVSCFHLPKDLTLTLVSGYSVPLRHRIVTRLQELENAKVQPVVALGRKVEGAGPRAPVFSQLLPVQPLGLPVGPPEGCPKGDGRSPDRGPAGEACTVPFAHIWRRLSPASPPLRA